MAYNVSSLSIAKFCAVRPRDETQPFLRRRHMADQSVSGKRSARVFLHGPVKRFRPSHIKPGNIESYLENFMVVLYIVFQVAECELSISHPQISEKPYDNLFV